METTDKAEAPFTIEVKFLNDFTLVELSGHIDELAADRLSSRLDEIFTSECGGIIFDLSEVYFMGSSGLGQIMRSYRQTKGVRENCVRIVNPQPLIQDLFRLTKLDKILRIYPDIKSALED